MKLESFEMMKILLKLSAWNYLNKKLVIKTGYVGFHESLILAFPAFERDARITETITRPNNIF